MDRQSTDRSTDSNDSTPVAPEEWQWPELLTASETVSYLRLNTDACNPLERLRNLIRRHGLPVIRRGGLQLFRRSEIDSWLDAGRRGGRRVGQIRRATPSDRFLRL